MDAETSVARHSTLRPVSQTENTKSEACHALKQLIKMNVSVFFSITMFRKGWSQNNKQQLIIQTV